MSSTPHVRKTFYGVYIQYVTQLYKYISADHHRCEKKKKTFGVEEELRADNKRF